MMYKSLHGMTDPRVAEFILETNYPSETRYLSETDNSSSINLVRRRIMKQNSSEADLSVEDVLTDG